MQGQHHRAGDQPLKLRHRRQGLRVARRLPRQWQHHRGLHQPGEKRHLGSGLCLPVKLPMSAQKKHVQYSCLAASWSLTLGTTHRAGRLGNRVWTQDKLITEGNQPDEPGRNVIHRFALR